MPGCWPHQRRWRPGGHVAINKAICHRADDHGARLGGETLGRSDVRASAAGVAVRRSLPRKSRLVRNDFMVGGRAAASIVIITAIILLFFFILPLLPSTSHRRSPRPTPRARSLCAFLAFLCENIRQRTPHVHECAIPTRIQNVPRWSVCSLAE